jgi:non-heme chloroperoxidase
MAFVTTKDGVNIFFKDWGPKEAQPIVFHHGWPLSADDWDNQMLFFLAEGSGLLRLTDAVMVVQIR